VKTLQCFQSSQFKFAIIGKGLKHPLVDALPNSTAIFHHRSMATPGILTFDFTCPATGYDETWATVIQNFLYEDPGLLNSLLLPPLCTVILGCAGIAGFSEAFGLASSELDLSP